MAHTIDFTDRVAIITGAGGGLGRAYALALAERGAKVVVNDLGGDVHGEGGTASAAQLVVDEITAAGGQAMVDGNDITDEAAVDALVSSVIEKWGRIDVLINNAGILRDKSFAKMSTDDFRKVLEVHLMGSVNCTKAVWPHMAEAGYGRILMTTSTSGIYGNFGQSNYAAAKSGLVGLMNVLAIEGAKKDIRVNAIAPTAATRMTEDLGMGQASEEDKAQMSPHWIAPLVTWLASEESRGVTGRVFDITGRAMSVSEGWHRGPTVDPTDDPTRVGPLVEEIVNAARPNADMSGRDEVT